jgi:hypothetical protein
MLSGLRPECDDTQEDFVASTGVGEAVHASSLSVLCWLDENGLPRARGVVALVRDDRPVIAFTYSDELVAREVARSARVALAITETRSTGPAFRPALLTGRPDLLEDSDGEVFVSDLLRQELRRYPPARLYADSPLLMREHWWYLPRLVVEVEVEEVEPLGAHGQEGHVLVVADGGMPVVRVATVRGRTQDRVELSVEGPVVAPGPAVLFGQDASFPDLEQWSQWRYRGHWDGSGLNVEEAPARTGLGRTPGLLQRWRRQRALERRCVEAIPRP